jgi:dTDP-4-dehydrorhamnose 3,5-epimerase-like enzyme
MNQYSKPIKIEKRIIGSLFYLNPRKNKPGRELVVDYDERFPLIDGFKNRYSYIVKIYEKGISAGNHYHHRKAEIMLPLEGKFEIFMEDIHSKEKDDFEIDSKDNIAFYVPTEVSHAIKLVSDFGIFLVVASNPEEEDDNIDYPVSR